MRQDQFTDEELRCIIDAGIEEAVMELRDQGANLSVECDHRNGNTDDVSGYIKRFKDGNLSPEDKSRREKIHAAMGHFA